MKLLHSQIHRPECSHVIKPIYGRYVLIRFLSNRKEQLVLCEVQVSGLMLTQSEFQTLITCERKVAKFNCSGNPINILYANYGRKDKLICSNENIGNTNCGNAAETLKIVKYLCHGKYNCEIPSENAVFGDPCPHINKYLEIHYTCKAKGLKYLNYVNSQDEETIKSGSKWEDNTGMIAGIVVTVLIVIIVIIVMNVFFIRKYKNHANRNVEIVDGTNMQENVRCTRNRERTDTQGYLAPIAHDSNTEMAEYCEINYGDVKSNQEATQDYYNVALLQNNNESRYQSLIKEPSGYRYQKKLVTTKCSIISL